MKYLLLSLSLLLSILILSILLLPKRVRCDGGEGFADDVYPVDDTYEHIFPLNDVREHTLVGINCICLPEVVIDGSGRRVIHNAFDYRGMWEQVAEILNGKQ